ncbi:hypothetical protein [Brevundimonas goettingensis]|jgi:hypothetical protein|uniref:Uncharacterized protein n=1 Tax=Brevundimonas goettingensis TaxID=2774190 RepID=A0A975C718_9CAUL|nr:hypothetical protein [Brevundimonas goettingensis]QTC92752.1 hypothetical protein IFJ75_07840 [Brevundimonas goettingensis]
MKTLSPCPDFDHQIFDLTVIGTALKDLQHRLATPVGGFPAAPLRVFR